MSVLKKRIIFLLMLLLTLLVATLVHAEQPEAEKYRQIILNGNYYIEYDFSIDEQKEAILDKIEENRDVIGAVIAGAERGGLLASKNGKCMKKMIISHGIFGNSIIPEIYYADHKYYLFSGDDKAIMATEEDLKNPRINYNGDWEQHRAKLNIPEPLIPFAPKGTYDDAIPEPKLVESNPGNAQEKKLTYDKYQATVYSAAGTVLYDYFFYIYYKEGQIDSAMLYWQEPGKQEKFYKGFCKIVITADVPEKHITLPEGCKVYQVGKGDMDDLLGNKVLLYTVGKEGNNNG